MVIRMSVSEMKKELNVVNINYFLIVGSDDGDKYKVFGVFVTTVSTLPNFKQVEVLLLKGEKKENYGKKIIIIACLSCHH